MRPTGLVQKVRSIVLSSTFGGNDLGDYEEEDDDLVKAWERTEVLAQELGAEVIVDEETFKSLLPEILSGSGRLFRFGSGLGLGTRDAARDWEVLREGLAALPANERNIEVLMGFLRGISGRSPKITASLLDTAVTDPTLGPQFPILQCAIPIDKRGVERLGRSLKLAIAPIEEYRRLAWGRNHETIEAADLIALVLEIGDKPGGVEPALEIAFFRLFGDKEKKQPHEAETIEAGRRLLSKLGFTQTNDPDDHKLGLIVRSCLSGRDGAHTARFVCERFKTGAMKAPSKVHHYNKFFEALCKTQPLIVLDTFFTGDPKEQGTVAEMLRWFGHLSRHPLDPVPDDQMIEWCDRDPDSRYPMMATVVSFLKGSEEEDVCSQWTNRALKLIELAPDPVAIVQKFTERFRPSVWSGSLASILEGRKALLEELKEHKNPEIAALATDEAIRLASEVDATRRWEAEHDRSRDERFE